MSRGVTDLTRALVYASRAHANQRRKGAAQEPYVNHLIEVMDLVAQATEGRDIELMQAAVLHDVIEDTGTSAAVLADQFGAGVARIVEEVSDDMSLSKEERRRRRLSEAAKKSRGAKMVKTADVISNIRALVVSAPAGWGDERRLSYLENCRSLVDACRGPSPFLEALFDRTAAGAERAIREGAVFTVDGHVEQLHALASEVGQKVHTVYMSNTSCRGLTRADVERLADFIGRQFPSVTILRADARFEGRLREVLLCHIRSDSMSAVVALAQSICVAFEQRFVGIEVDGRYIRIYADDTG